MYDLSFLLRFNASFYIFFFKDIDADIPYCCLPPEIGYNTRLFHKVVPFHKYAPPD